MQRKITVVQGHPDPAGGHYGHALAQAYIDGARAAGHEVRSIAVAHLDFPLLRTQHEWKCGALPDCLREAQQDLYWAEHLVIFFPLWLGTLPALLKGFLEQVLRVGGSEGVGNGQEFARPLTGKSARIVVTMGMPARAFRWYFFAQGLKLLERNILAFCGAGPIRGSLIGRVEGMGEGRAVARQKWLEKMQALGRAGR
jgi:putative NADPH-quinone reductase